MSSSGNKAVHPFFQQQQKKKQSRPKTPPGSAHDLSKPRLNTESSPRSPRSEADPLLYINKGEGSKPRQLSKPTFYAEIYDQEPTFDHFGQPHTTKPKQLRDDHEFSRLNVLGTAHVTDKVFEPWQPLVKRRSTPPPVAVIPPQQIYRRCHSRRRCLGQLKGDQPMLPSIHTQHQLEEYLDIQFPLWHRYASCKELCQTIFCTKLKDDHRPWTEKYRPHTVKGLVGDRHHHVYLKDWLHQMKIAPISASTPANHASKKKKKQQKAVVVKPNLDHSDDEELMHHLSLYDDDKDEDFVMDNKKKVNKDTSIRSNVILIMGDHGIGKTASVYTAAEELGYEVFEINSGSKRSGKDVMALVGEMTKSHLVTFATPASVAMTAPNLKKKKKLNPYFAPTQSTSSMVTTTKKGPGLLKHFAKTKKPTTVSNTKQSLILLEEVDLLFEEDKGFWPSVIELSQKSKRPIVMTCNDPDQIPFENLCLQKVLGLEPPNEDELLPYLWLVCFAEGFMMQPTDLICLIALLGRDIRQLLQTLSLYAGEDAFGKYLGLSKEMDAVEVKEKCIPCRGAVDTFRLALCYLNGDSTTGDGDDDELENIVQALNNSAFIDTWLGYKENGNQVCEMTEDQINGYTGLWVKDTKDTMDMTELESTLSVLNSQTLSSSGWQKLIANSSSHYEELNDARIHTLEDYKDAIEKLLPISYIYQPYTTLLTLDYIPHIQAMLYYDHKNKSKTRSKRRRLYLPLNQEAVASLTSHGRLVDETEYWINRLEKLKKE